MNAPHKYVHLGVWKTLMFWVESDKPKITMVPYKVKDRSVGHVSQVLC